MLAACTDPQKPSEATFKAAIQAALDKDPVCISLPREMPVETDPEGRYLSLGMRGLAKLNALVDAGLATRTPTPITRRGHFVSAESKIDGLRYELTEAGRKLMEESQAQREPQGFFASQRGALCYGHYTVSEIVRFTEPGAINGVTISHVTFKKEVQNPAAWAKHPAVQAAWSEISDSIKPTQNSQATLVLTSEGWVHEHMMQL